MELAGTGGRGRERKLPNPTLLFAFAVLFVHAKYPPLNFESYAEKLNMEGVAWGSNLNAARWQFKDKSISFTDATA